MLFQQLNQFDDPTEDRFVGCVRMETKRQAQLRKEKKKEEKKFQREFNKIIAGLGTEERMDIELARIEQMRQRKEELMSGVGFEPNLVSVYRPKRNLPYVFDAYESTPLTEICLSTIKMSLPEGTTRKITTRYHEVTVPAQERSAALDVHPVMIESLDPVCSQMLRCYPPNFRLVESHSTELRN